MVQKSNNKIVSKEAPEYDFAQLHIQGPYTDTPGFFFHSFCCWTFASCMNRERLINNVSMFHFLDTNIREKKSMKWGYRYLYMICVMTSSLKIVWKTKITFLLSKTLLFFLERKYILFSETYVFKIAKDLITFFWPRQILKNKDMPRKKP